MARKCRYATSKNSIYGRLESAIASRSAPGRGKEPSYCSNYSGLQSLHQFSKPRVLLMQQPSLSGGCLLVRLTQEETKRLLDAYLEWGALPLLKN